MSDWQPMSTAPKTHGAQVLGWFPKVKLDEEDNPTTEVIGGAMAQIEWQGTGWTEPEWLSAHGSYFFEDWCFAEEPVLWHPLPSSPPSPLGDTPDTRKPWEKTSWTCARARVSPDGVHCPPDRCSDCIGDTPDQQEQKHG